MTYKFFYMDYCEGKEIPAAEAWECDLAQFLHSMNCVLHMPDNFIGLNNQNQQTLQFVVEKDKSITIDIPLLENGQYIKSKTDNRSLEQCLELVGSLKGDEDFYKLLPDEEPPKPSKKAWWKIW